VSAGIDLYAPNMYLIDHRRTNALESCASTVETLIRSEHSEAAYGIISGRRTSAAAKLGWIIVGRRVVVVSAQTTRNGVVAIDPHAIGSGVAWDHGLAGTNHDMSRFGMLPSCGGVRRNTESDQKA